MAKALNVGYIRIQQAGDQKYDLLKKGTRIGGAHKTEYRTWEYTRQDPEGERTLPITHKSLTDGVRLNFKRQASTP